MKFYILNTCMLVGPITDMHGWCMDISILRWIYQHGLRWRDGDSVEQPRDVKRSLPPDTAGEGEIHPGVEDVLRVLRDDWKAFW